MFTMYKWDEAYFSLGVPDSKTKQNKNFWNVKDVHVTLSSWWLDILQASNIFKVKMCMEWVTYINSTTIKDCSTNTIFLNEIMKLVLQM